MKPLSPSKRARSLLIGNSLLVLFVILATCLIRRSSWFSNYAELPLYDNLTQSASPWTTGHPDVVLVTIRNPDIWPLDDANLATCLEKLSSAGPKALAVDLIRDSYRASVTLDPQNGAERVKAVLGLNPRIIMADGLAVGDDPGFKFLPSLQEDPNWKTYRVGFANFPRDGDPAGTVRRGIILAMQEIQDGSVFRLSLPALTVITSRLENPNPEVETYFNEFSNLVDDVHEKAAFAKNKGGYSSQEVADNQFLIKYSGNLDSLFPNYSYHQIVNEMSDEELRTHFKGKIILLGTNDSNTAKDEIPVIGNPNLRGVKLLALATSQLLREMETDEAPIRTSQDWQEDSLIIIFAILSSLVAWWASLRGNFFSLATLPLQLLLAWLVGFLALKNGFWIPMAAPALASLTSGAFTTALVTNRIRRDRHQFSSLLELQVGAQVSEKIKSHREALQAKERIPPELFDGTSFFSDLIGFTGITNDFQGRGGNKDRTHELFDWLNNYLSAMVDIIIRHDGFIQKFNGDGIFAVFGYPGDPDHAQKAVACAAEIRETLPTLNQKLTSDLPPYFVRIGLYSGPIHAGSVGGLKQLVFDFLGETINKSARLETLEKSDFQPSETTAARILVSEETKNELIDQSKVQLFQNRQHKLDTRISQSENVWEFLK